MHVKSNTYCFCKRTCSCLKCKKLHAFQMLNLGWIDLTLRAVDLTDAEDRLNIAVEKGTFSKVDRVLLRNIRAK